MKLPAIFTILALWTVPAVAGQKGKGKKGRKAHGAAAGHAA